MIRVGGDIVPHNLILEIKGKKSDNIGWIDPTIIGPIIASSGLLFRDRVERFDSI
jgi:hypothetical protein